MRGHHLPWWYAVTAHPCTTCGAAPGQSCITTSGRPRGEPHAARARLASAHGWRNPDEREDHDGVPGPPG